MIALLGSFIGLLCLSTIAVWCYSQLNPDSIKARRTLTSVLELFSPPRRTPRDLLLARAIPNTRLIRAFSLTNTFVSADPNVHAYFVGHANSLLRAAISRGWTYFQDIAVDAVDVALSDDARLDFDSLVQDVTLRVALVGLLGVDTGVGDLTTDDIKVVTKLITKLWSLSKKPEPIPAHLLPRLNYHLRRLILDTEAYPNPLDYVIPVWETLWRVVATVIGCIQNNDSARDAFAQFNQLPTPNQFRAFEKLQPSVEAIISEAMRLYPPSKRIARATPHGPLLALLQRLVGGSPVLHECADIGTVLRSDVWGADAEQFEPLRFHSSRLRPEQERLKLLPFGHGRHRCIATSWAPMAAALIAGAILDRVGDEKSYKLVVGDHIGGREGWKGWIIVEC